MTLPQVYLTPTLDGWAALVYGDERIPDDTLVPLPLTPAVTYEAAWTFLAATPLAVELGGVTDGLGDHRRGPGVRRDRPSGPVRGRLT